MAEFGPKVFHALGRYADKDGDNTFKTAKPSDVGLKENNRSESEIQDDLEKLKNAIFKLVMLRTRNHTQILGQNRVGQMAKDNKISVTFTIAFGDQVLHPEKASAVIKGVTSVDGIIVFPDYTLDHTTDIKALQEAIEKLSAACGSSKDFDNIFSNDPIYQTLWPQ